MENTDDSITFQSNRITEFVLKYVSICAILAITTLFTPNFNIESFPILLLSGIVILVLDYMMSIVSGVHDFPIGRGIVGFISAAIIFYMIQFFVAGYYISILSTLIAAAIYGTIDGFLPNNE